MLKKIGEILTTKKMQGWINQISSPGTLLIYVVLFPLFYNSFGELDSDLYPIIINTDGDKAVFILPDLGCHVVDDLRLVDQCNEVTKLELSDNFIL